jgi:hypothetical protein
MGTDRGAVGAAGGVVGACRRIAIGRLRAAETRPHAPDCAKGAAGALVDIPNASIFLVAAQTLHRLFRHTAV